MGDCVAAKCRPILALLDLVLAPAADLEVAVMPRRFRRLLFLSAAVLATSASTLVGSASAGPPVVEQFEVTFPESGCPDVRDPLLARLQIRITDQQQPDGTVHHGLDITGTITNVTSGDSVRLHATRRFFDNPTADRTRFAGLQNRFSAPGHGVLHLNAGWAAGALSESMVDYALRGRWDGLDVSGLPPSVCEVLG